MTILLRISILIMAVLGTGCATSMKYQTGVTPVKAGFELVDKRPAADKEGKVLAWSASDCESGVHRLGDQQIVPDRLVILSNGLESRLGAALAGKKLLLTRFEILNNNHGETGMLFIPVNGIMVMMPQGVGCTAPYLLVDNPHNLAAVIVTLELAVDGISYQQRSVQIEPQGGSDQFINGPTHMERLTRGLDAAVQGIASKIALQQGTAQAPSPTAQP